MFRTGTLIGSIITGRRTLTLAIAALVALVMAASALTVAPQASAEPPAGGSGAAGCEYGGYTYNTGERIVVFSGAHYDTYYCAEDGTWRKVEQVVKPVPVKLPTTTNEHFAATRNR